MTKIDELSEALRVVAVMLRKEQELADDLADVIRNYHVGGDPEIERVLARYREARA